MFVFLCGNYSVLWPSVRVLLGLWNLAGNATHSYPPFYGYQYLETMGCHQKSPTDYYGDINYDEFPNGSDIMGVHMASKSSKKVTFEFVLKLLSFLSDI